MSALTGILVGVAAKVGAPLVKRTLERVVGKAGAELAGEVIGTIAEYAGTTEDKLPDLPAPQIEDAVRATESDMPEILAQWNDSQRMTIDFLTREMDKGPTWTWAWRPAAMWTINALWVWALAIVPSLNAFGAGIAPVDLVMLFQLSLLFMGLYMGGHTVLRGIERWRAK